MTSLQLVEQGSGRVESLGDGAYSLQISPQTANSYANAQVADYVDRRGLSQSAPCEMELYARFDGIPAGTAGFGFWNAPYGARVTDLRLPNAAWFFFASSHSNMPLATGRKANGWKAAVFAPRLPLFLPLLPIAPLGFLLMRVPSLHRALWPVGQHALGVSEYDIPANLMYERTQYRLRWLSDRTEFYINGALVLTAGSPRGRLGFIAWIDNQYAVVAPQGHFGGGTVDIAGDQRLTIDGLTIRVP